MASFDNLTIGQQTVFHRILSNVGFNAEVVNEIIKDPSLAKKMLCTVMIEQSKFAKYRHLLRSLDRQAIELDRLNKKMPRDIRVPNSWFDNLERNDDDIQTIEKLKFYFVVKDTFKKTLAYNWKLIEAIQPGFYHSFSINDAHLRLDENAYKYNPGIHLIEINLVDNWTPKNSTLVNHVRELAKTKKKILAGVEVIAAYALQDPRLLRLQDGENLPYCYLAGLQQGDDFCQTPFLFWNSNYCNAHLETLRSDIVQIGYAAPSIKKC